MCCYAEQDKVWVWTRPETPWEVYTITDDDPANAATPAATAPAATSDTVLTVQSAPAGGSSRDGVLLNQRART